MAQDERTRTPQGEAPRTLPPGTRIAICSSTYHGELIELMRASARRVLTAAGVADANVFEVRVPGAFELPIVARRCAMRPDVHAVLCFGLVLRGETDHDRYISHAVAQGLIDVSLETDTPVLFGVLTPNDLQQAERRARPREQGGLDKGREVASAAIEVLLALRAVDSLGNSR
jgi:6,7-dimethyl-8-ribityllumazine synthase